MAKREESRNCEDIDLSDSALVQEAMRQGFFRDDFLAQLTASIEEIQASPEADRVP